MGKRKTTSVKFSHFWERYKLAVIVFFTVIAVFAATQVLLYRYANPLLNGIITRVIKEQTDGLYRVKFDDLRIDMRNRSFHLKNFQLIPNKQMYWDRVAQGEISTALYRIGIPQMDITGIDSYSLFWQQQFDVEDFFFDRPIVKLVAAPRKDGSKPRKSYEAINRDLYPAVAGLFKSIEIDRIRVREGYFDLHRSQEEDEAETRFDDLSITLFHFSLNEENYRKRDRLFFADDMRIEVSDYQLNLSDSIHKVAAKDILISTKEKRIEAENIQLEPTQTQRKNLGRLDMNLLDISVPELSVKGFNLSDAFFRGSIDLQSAKLSYPYIRVFKQKTDTTVTPDSVVLQRSPRINLYELIKGTLQEVQLDTFTFHKAFISLYQNVDDVRPMLVSRSLSVNLGDFLVDSASYYDQERIFFARGLDLSMKNYTMYLADSIHRLNAGELFISTEKNHIIAKQVHLHPFAGKSADTSKYNINVPLLGIYGIDLARAYNDQRYNIATLSINAPEANINRFAGLATPKDSIRRFTSDELYQLTSNYLSALYIRDIYLRDGNVRIKNQLKSGNFLQSSGHLSFHLQSFQMSPHSVFRQQKPFNADHVRFTLTDYQSNVPNSNYLMFADTLHVSSPDSMIHLHRFTMKLDTARMDTTAKQELVFRAEDMEIADADIPAIYFKNKFRAGYMRLKQPDIRIKMRAAGKSQKDTAAAGRFVDSIPAFAKDTAIIDFMAPGEADKMLVYKMLFANSDTLLVRDTVMQPGNTLIADTLRANYGLAALRDTFAISGNTIRFGAPPDYTRKGFDELVVSQLGSAMEAFPLRSLVLDSLDVSAGYIAMHDSLRNSRAPRRLVTNYDFSLKKIRLHPGRIYHERRSPLFADTYNVVLRNLAMQLPEMPYTLAVDSMCLLEQKRSLALKGLSLQSKGKEGPLYRLKFPMLRFSGLQVSEIYQHGQVHLDSVHLKQPQLLYAGREAEPDMEQQNPDSLKLPFPELLQDIQVGNFWLKDGEAGLFKQDTTQANQWLKTGLSLKLDSFSLDEGLMAATDSLIAHQKGDVQIESLHYRHNDGLHTVLLDSMHVNLSDSALNGWGLSLAHPKNARYARKLEMLERAGQHTLMQVQIPRFYYKKLNLHRLLKNKELNLRSFHLDSPNVSINTFPFLKRAHPESPRFGSMVPLPGSLRALSIDTMHMPGADVEVSIYQPDTTRYFEFTDVTALAEGFSIDSSSMQDKFLFSNNLELVLKDHAMPVPNSYYKAHTSKITLGTRDKRLTIHDPLLYPKESRYELASKLDWQSSVMRLEGKALRFRNVNFPALLNKQEIRIGKTFVDSLNILVYKDKRVPLDSSDRKPDFHDLLNVDEPYFYLDTVVMNNGYVLYEQTSPIVTQKARIDLVHLNVRGTDITNDSAFHAKRRKVRIKVNMKLENQGLLQANFNFPAGSPSGAYTITGRLDTMALAAFNPIIEPIALVRIRDGKIQQVRFVIDANDTLARGKVRIRYNDLKLAFLDEETGSTEGTRQEVTSFVANTILRSSNPKFKWFPPKKGNIYFRREEAQPVFNFWVGALLSGAKSTFGFESKEMKKELKRQEESLSRKQADEIRNRLDFEN